MSLQLIQFDGNTVTPKDDSVVNDLIFGTYGIFNGCEITFLGVNVIKVASGRLLIKGRQVVVLEEEINVQLSSSGSQLGRLYLKMDLSNTENPVTFESEVDTELRELTQESDANYTNGIFEVELCNYEVSETAISNILSTCPIIISATQVLDTLEEIEANEQSGLAAGALALKAVNENLGYMFLSTFLSKTPIYIVSQSSPTTNRITYTATEPCLVTYWGYTSSVSEAAQILAEINGREVSRFGTYYGTNATGSNGMSHLLNTGDKITIFPANGATLYEMVVY